MQITRDPDASHAISAYAAGAVQIGGNTYRGGVIATREKILGDWRPPAVERLSIADFEALIALAPEVVLLGTGPAQQLPPAELYAEFAARRIGLEAMDSRAACRTYNLLLSEYREVAVALMP